MPVTLQLQHEAGFCTQPTRRAMQVAAMFGLSLAAHSTHTVLPPIEIPLAPGRVVFITGASGGGKSTCLRLIEERLHVVDAANPPSVVRLDKLPALAGLPLVDALAWPEGDQQGEPAGLERVCRWLSLAGLNDAVVMLRRPGELSEGQRHRLRLAQGLAAAECRDAPWSVLLADEFGSTLDRTTASALARSARRWVSRSKACLVVATSHDDLLEPLSPDVLVETALGGRCAVHTRTDNASLMPYRA